MKMKILAALFAVCFILTSCAALSPETDTSEKAQMQTDVPAQSTSAADTAEDSETVTDTAVEDTTDNNESTVAETGPAETAPPETEAETAPQTENSVKVDVPVGSFEPEALMYHLILEDVYSVYEALFVRPTEFEAHLTVLDELGYEYLFAEEWRVTETPSVIITLDDGYEDNYTNMFPILKAHGAKATVFLVTDLIDTDGYLTREQIKEMSDSGLVSFQCHTARHVDLSHLSAEDVRGEFTESVGIIEEITGKPVRALAYPAGSYNDTVLQIVPEFFDFAYTTKSPNSTPEYTSYTVPRHYIARGYGREAFSSFVRY